MPYDKLPTAEEFYKDGLGTGKTWKAPWKPGGPWVPTQSSGDTPEATASRVQMQANKEAWLRGWKDGVAKSQESS